MEENAKPMEEKPKNDLPVAPPMAVETKPKKPRKEYQWTEKRKEAFDKMRKGLEEKISLTKQIKEEKRKAEKEAIKAQVREIMASKKKAPAPVVDSCSSDDSSDESVISEEEMPKSRKKSQKEKKLKEKSKRKVIEYESESMSEKTDSDISSDDEPPMERRVSSRKQRAQTRRDKDTRGKAVRRAQFLNPMDQFILL